MTKIIKKSAILILILCLLISTSCKEKGVQEATPDNIMKYLSEQFKDTEISYYECDWSYVKIESGYAYSAAVFSEAIDEGIDVV